MGSHKEWRKIAKKERRRRIRTQKAKARCEAEKNEETLKLTDENYQAWATEQERLEAFKEVESERIRKEENEKWLEREEIAQRQWRELQEKIAKAKFERAQQDLRIKKEWEEEQKKIKEAEENRKKKEEEQIRCHEEMMKRIAEFASGSGDLPNELRTMLETNPEREVCPFFSKIGVCRFGDSCSRNHRKPGVSRIILAKNLYLNYGIEHSNENECDTDVLLESDDRETYKHFKEFFDDVLPEFQQIGRVIQFKVCCNFERHLRGNTYIEYESLRDAVKAYQAFHGRWYGGKQISLQFCDVPSWKQAICGLFAGKRCPKGKTCNFLHVFHNPGNMFNDFGRRHERTDHPRRSDRSSRSWSRNKENGKSWRWSESPERKTDEKSSNQNSKDSKRHRHRHKKSSRHRDKREKNERKHEKRTSDHSNRSNRQRHSDSSND